LARRLLCHLGGGAKRLPRGPAQSRHASGARPRRPRRPADRLSRRRPVRLRGRLARPAAPLRSRDHPAGTLLPGGRPGRRAARLARDGGGLPGRAAPGAARRRPRPFRFRALPRRGARIRSAGETMRLNDKVAVITGSAGGIGLATACRFAAEGAAVVLADVKEAALAGAREQVLAAAPRATVLPVTVDVTQAQSVQAMVAAAIERFGRIDCLVNNAGITADARLVKMTDEQFDRVIAVNLKGVYRCTQAVADPMIRQGSGVVIN